MELGSEEKAKKASFKIVCLMMRECELDPLAPMSTTLEYGGSTRSELREFRGCGLCRFGIDRHIKAVRGGARLENTACADSAAQEY